MPLRPLVLERPLRFDPAYVTEDDLDDLSSFTRMTPERCLERLRSYSPSELAQAWRVANPQSPAQVLDFYRSTELYIWDLMQWHASYVRLPYWEALVYLTERYPAGSGWQRVCDFGCGVGTDALFLASHGYSVTLIDVDSPAFRFARHRFHRRGVDARFLESQSMLPEIPDLYDVVVCFDVFEHLPDPLEAARRLVHALRDSGLFLQQGAFDDRGDHPCHLADGVRRFRGWRWHIELARLGLQNVSGLVYRKGGSVEHFLQQLRYGLWRATGMWLVRARR